jgi:hypothetical protein
MGRQCSTSPGRPPTGIGCDYRRRVPFAPLAAFRRTVVVLVFGLVGVAVVGGCGAHREATGFCATIRRGHGAFDSTDAAHATRALDEFDRVAASAPATVAPDLKVVSAFLSALYHDPASVAKDPAAFERYAAATGRVDSYLHDTCGVHIPPAGKFR